MSEYLFRIGGKQIAVGSSGGRGDIVVLVGIVLGR